VKTAAEAQAAGCSRNSEIWPDKIIEVQPTGSGGAVIVWEWHAWDHLIQDIDPGRANYGVIADHPELLDVNCGASTGGWGGGWSGGWGGDWMHVNGISYNPELDQIVFSSHYLNEFFVIDHGTTTQEAAGQSGGRYGRGGDFLYRWGNPENYDRGNSGGKVFYTVHNSYWVPAGLPGAGHIIAFNNGNSRPDGSYSSIEEIILPQDNNGTYPLLSGQAFGPDGATWRYTDLRDRRNYLRGNI
jgi:hypothetical protein